MLNTKPPKFLGKIRIKPGLTLFEYSNGQIRVVDPKQEKNLVITPGTYLVQKLNRKSAIKHFKKILGKDYQGP